MKYVLIFVVLFVACLGFSEEQKNQDVAFSLKIVTPFEPTWLRLHSVWTDKTSNEVIAIFEDSGESGNEVEPYIASSKTILVKLNQKPKRIRKYLLTANGKKYHSTAPHGFNDTPDEYEAVKSIEEIDGLKHYLKSWSNKDIRIYSLGATSHKLKIDYVTESDFIIVKIINEHGNYTISGTFLEDGTIENRSVQLEKSILSIDERFNIDGLEITPLWDGANSIAMVEKNPLAIAYLNQVLTKLYKSDAGLKAKKLIQQGVLIKINIPDELAIEIITLIESEMRDFYRKDG